MKKIAIAFALVTFIAACGGGGGSTGPVPPTPPVTLPPVTTPPVVVPPVTVPPVVTNPETNGCAAVAYADPVVNFGTDAMANICRSVYVEPGTSADDIISLRSSVTLALKAVSEFYGPLRVVQPDIILCRTAACRQYFIGSFGAVSIGVGTQVPGSSYKAPRNSIMIVYPSFVALGRTTLAHELAHAELNARVAGGSGVPAWFNEGQAVMIGKDPDCTDITATPVANLRSLDNGVAWISATSAVSVVPTQIYCQANREVTAWIAKNGRTDFLMMLDQIKSGAPFDSVYGALIN